MLRWEYLGDDLGDIVAVLKCDRLPIWIHHWEKRELEE
jgi:hypothetical protein